MAKRRRRNAKERKFKVPRSGTGIIKLVRKLVRLNKGRRKPVRLSVKRVKR